MQNVDNVLCIVRIIADALFSKTVYNCSSGMLHSFILHYMCLPKLSSVLCRIPKANFFFYI